MTTPLSTLPLCTFCFALCAAVAQTNPGGRFIEAEQFTHRSPGDGSFATTLQDPHAHLGEALSRFFVKQGQTTYAFQVDRPGPLILWVRYAAMQDQSLSWALDAPPGQPARAGTSQTPLPSTGGLEGPSAWRWTRLGMAALKPGKHTLTVYSAPIRLDCFWLADDDSPPPEVALQERPLEETRRHLLNPIEPVTPPWLAGADAYHIPAWYDAIRVCAHTRLSLKMREQMPETFLHFAQLMHSIGFLEIARHIRGGGEGAWWPSAVGAVLPEAQQHNFAQEIIDEARRNGCRIMVYHRHMEDVALAKQHPDWRAIDEKGRPVTKRGPMLCLNSPFAGAVQARLVELAHMGADGFYFDEVHMNKPLCWCGTCRRGFKDATGMEFPASPDPSDPAYQKAVEYRNTVLERVFRQWRAAIHQANPECVMLIGSNSYPAMNDRHTTHRLWRITDAMKTEFNLAARTGNNRIFLADKSLAPPETGARIALGYTISRDACDGRPPHIWAHGIPDATQMRYATAGMITHGAVANLDHNERDIPDKALFGPAVEMGNRAAPAFAGTRPLRWAALHFSEFARDHYLPDEAAAWKQVLYPIHGAFTTLLRAHLPVGIVTDSQLEQGRLDGYHVLFLPSPTHLTGPMRQAVAAFKARGGLVVEQQPAWEWHQPGDGMKKSSAAFLASLKDQIAKAPVQALGGPTNMHMVAFQSPDGKRLTISLANDFSWVQTGKEKANKSKSAKPQPPRTPSGEGENEATIGEGPQNEPPPCTGVQITVRLPGTPASIKEMITGRDLKPVPQPDGFRLDLPDFDCLSVIAIEFPP
jgi:hypothetical protein